MRVNVFSKKFEASQKTLCIINFRAFERLLSNEEPKSKPNDSMGVDA
jgi:hypothetical protein